MFKSTNDLVMSKISLYHVKHLNKFRHKNVVMYTSSTCSFVRKPIVAICAIHFRCLSVENTS